MKTLRNERGFTLIYLVAILVAVSVVAAVAVKVIDQSIAEARKIQSINEIQDIQRAIYGDERLRDQTEFGFVGDMGRLPTSLDELLVRPEGADGNNWNGPYLQSDFVEDPGDLLVDQWGNLYEYDPITGQIGLSENSIGDEPIYIPEPFENIEEMLYGGIEGSIVDSLGNPPMKGDRRHILVWMEPINTEEWPAITFDTDRDMAIFHMERGWLFHHPFLNAILVWSDPIDHGRSHWRWGWRWCPPGHDPDIDDDSYDDHLPQFWPPGHSRRFDPHFHNFWTLFTEIREYYDEFIKIKVFIHPDRYGDYAAEEIPVKPYIITAYHDVLEMSLKRYVVIEPDEKATVNFRFPSIFPGYDIPVEDPPPPGGGDPPEDMAAALSVTGDLAINGFIDNGVMLGNSGTQPIEIDEIRVSWSNSSAFQRVLSIRINNNQKWTGREKSGNLLNISDTTIMPGDNVPLNFIFNRNLSGRLLELEFHMKDGSSLDVDQLPLVNN
ncbi:hypothetical protein ACFL6I_07785 [candidate division KSB1 bacterium]